MSVPREACEDVDEEQECKERWVVGKVKDTRWTVRLFPMEVGCRRLSAESAWKMLQTQRKYTVDMYNLPRNDRERNIIGEIHNVERFM